MTFLPAADRYEAMQYRRTGRSGLLLPAVSLGLWHNFGGDRSLEIQRDIIRRAFDLGITHFDLANNYGPPYGSAEENFGRILYGDLLPYRDELVISTKAGYDMWPGPYGEWGSKKYLLASLDQSLGRMGLEYVDIFYSHRFDPDTPLEETLDALDTAVRQGKALYVGISSYSAERTRHAVQILRDLGTQLLIHQPSYSMLTAGSSAVSSTPSARRESAASCSRHSLRVCLPTDISTESRRALGPAGRARSPRACSPVRTSRRSVP
jgi:L-glyceraldehyde 3-phosphate reductase